VTPLLGLTPENVTDAAATLAVHPVTPVVHHRSWLQRRIRVYLLASSRAT
jgi:hypothetical protein